MNQTLETSSIPYIQSGLSTWLWLKLPSAQFGTVPLILHILCSPMLPSSDLPFTADFFWITSSRSKSKKYFANIWKYIFFSDRRWHIPLYAGMWMWLSAKYVRLKPPSTKLGPLFIGPNRIISWVGSVSHRLKIPSSLKIDPVFHVFLLKQAKSNHYSRTQQPPPPVLIDRKQEYEISKIQDSRREYLVHWMGNPITDRSWPKTYMPLLLFETFMLLFQLNLDSPL